MQLTLNQFDHSYGFGAYIYLPIPHYRVPARCTGTDTHCMPLPIRMIGVLVPATGSRNDILRSVGNAFPLNMDTDTDTSPRLIKKFGGYRFLLLVKVGTIDGQA